MAPAGPVAAHYAAVTSNPAVAHGVEDGSHVLSGGIRFLGTTLGGEAGVAYWLEDGMEIRPVVSVAYRF